MRLTKQFAPITIYLETEKDRNDFIVILDAAFKSENKLSFYTHPLTEIQAKIKYLRSNIV